MGAAQSNISSDVDSLNWTETQANDIGVKTINKNGIEIIDIDLPNIENTESDTESIANVFEKLEHITNQQSNINNVNEQVVSAESSPFISTDMYNKIMNVQANTDNASSPFINTDKYNEIMQGGFKDDSSSSETDDSDDSTSDSEILRALSEIYLSSDMMPKSKENKEKHTKSKHHKDKKTLSTSSNMSDIKKTYGFSETSSEMIKTSENNYYINNATTSDTPYKVESSEINTSDINLVSVDSRNGKRFI